MSDKMDTVEGLLEEARYFCTKVAANPTAYQVTAAQLAQLDTLTNAAEEGLELRTGDENALTTSRAVVKSTVAALGSFFRPLRQSVKENPATTEVQRAELHLTAAGGKDNPNDSLEIAPLVLVEQSGVHQHRVNFFMQGEASGTIKKPKGVFGALIYQKIGGEATSDLKDYELITLDSKSPYVYDFDPADAGKTAHYIVLWTTADDDRSPQSEVFSLTIT